MNLINSEPTQTEIKMFKYAGLYLFEKQRIHLHIYPFIQIITLNLKRK